MTLFEILTILLSLAAVLSWLNHRLIRLPNTIGLMAIALALSLVLSALPEDNPLTQDLIQLVDEVHFEETLLHGLLGFLLFAGALHVDLNALSRYKAVIFILASASVAGAMLIIGLGAWLLFWVLNLQVPLVYCLLFGALISPTDPIAVLGILKDAKAPASLNIKITGESLFNDGVAVVLFLTLAGVASGKHQDPLGILWLFGYEVIGGLLVGLSSGALVLAMLRRVDAYQVEVLLTLALAAGTYSLAERLHVSAPIAIAVAGLIIGHHGRHWAMSETTRRRLDEFWELIDEILNAVLFLLIGFEVLALDLSIPMLVAGALTIPLVLVARALSIWLPTRRQSWRAEFDPATVTLMTWAGVRGGISIALALSLPASESRAILVSVTYVVVVFSILVQGLTLGPLTKQMSRQIGRSY